MTDLAADDTLTLTELAAELRSAIETIRDAGDALAEAESAAELAYLRAHAESTTMHPDRKVDEHKTAAKLAAFDEWSTANALRYGYRAARERAHTLRQILMAKQTELRVHADAGGPF